METLFTIIGVVAVGIFILGFFGIKKNVNRYRNLLQTVMNQMDERGYKNSNIYKERMEAIKEQGLSESMLNVMTHIRELVMRDFNVAPSFFSNPDVLNIQNLFMMKYAIAHGYGDEFQRSMVLGKEIEDIMASKK